MKPNRGTMIFGTIIFVTALAAWLYGETLGIDTNIVWVIAGPVIVALFVGPKLDSAAAAAEQAAQQTNGALDGRIKAAMTSALADRDAARTRQQLGDISQDAAPRRLEPPPAPDVVTFVTPPS